METINHLINASNSYLSLYKGANTGQGNAMGRIVANSRKAIGLTGTLMNGYASSLFHLLYRLNPKLMKDLGYEHNQISDFVKNYGSFETKYEAKTINKEGVVTRMGRRIGLPKERAKISPHLLSVLLGMTIFLKLDEIKMPNNLQLPPYEEVVDLVEMEDDLKKPYLAYIEELSSMIRTNKSLLGSFAAAAIALPDMPFTYRDEQGLISYNPEFTRKEYGLTNKEKRLIENVRAELDQGRDCLVYLTFSKQQIATDLKNILSDAFPDKKVLFLPSSVPAAKRKEWIKKNPSDVLICNPELVKTGLTLLNFVTIIFYETTYNVFTLKQASRRSWRIGQTENIKVIFMAYADTPQHKALELIGAKIMAANSLEGKFSAEEDLSSLGEDDTNLQLALAKSIMNGESSSKNIEMTSIKNFGSDRDYNNFELYYQSLLDEDKKLRKLEEEQKSLIAEVQEAKQETTIIAVEPKSLEITFDNMVKTFATNLLEHHNSGDLYGGIKSTFIGYKNKEEVTTSTMGAYPLFEINEKYRNGEVDGLAVSYDRDEENFITSIKVRSVYCNGLATFETKEQVATLSANVLSVIFDECNGNVEELSKILSVHLKARNKIASKKSTPKPLKKEIENQEIGFVGIIGKGKKAKRVRATTANNLFDMIPESTGTTNCIQMAFDF